MGKRGPMLSWKKLIKPDRDQGALQQCSQAQGRIVRASCARLGAKLCDPSSGYSMFLGRRWSGGGAEGAACAHCSSTRCLWHFSTVSPLAVPEPGAAPGVKQRAVRVVPRQPGVPEHAVLWSLLLSVLQTSTQPAGASPTAVGGDEERVVQTPQKPPPRPREGLSKG